MLRAWLLKKRGIFGVEGEIPTTSGSKVHAGPGIANLTSPSHQDQALARDSWQGSRWFSNGRIWIARTASGIANGRSSFLQSVLGYTQECHPRKEALADLV